VQLFAGLGCGEWRGTCMSLAHSGNDACDGDGDEFDDIFFPLHDA
jgi:hypothetical protein